VSVWFVSWLCIATFCLLWVTNFFGLLFIDTGWASLSLSSTLTYF
jgi:hypothetical protein